MMQMASFSEFWQFPDSDKVIWQHSSCSEQDFHCTVFDLVKQQRYISNSYSKIAIGGAVNIAIDLYFLPSLECLLVTLEPQPPSKSANVIETRWKLTSGKVCISPQDKHASTAHRRTSTIVRSDIYLRDSRRSQYEYDDFTNFYFPLFLKILHFLSRDAIFCITIHATFVFLARKF